ncbi:MAG: hypothetical protein ACUVUQ_02195 [Thermodesulfovibrionales bacterium]
MPLPGSNRGYKAWHYIEPIILMLYGGGKHIEDLRGIAEDKALRKLIVLNTIASISTVGDWLRRMGNSEGLDLFKHVIGKAVEKALRIHDCVEYTLWSDPTLIEADKQGAKMTYEGFKEYRPIITAFKGLPIIGYHQFREGNAIGDVIEALKGAYTILPESKRIRHASLDSEFYNAEVINFLMQKGTTFMIAADKDASIKEAIKRLNNWRPFKLQDGTLTDREIAETIHTMNKTEESFRLILLRWQNDQIDLFNHQRYNYHVIATNLEGSAEEAVWGGIMTGGRWRTS